MIELRDVEDFVEARRGVCLEVFSSIVSNPAGATQKGAIASAKLYCDRVQEKYLNGPSPLKNSSSIVDCAKSLDIETLCFYAEACDPDLQKKGLTPLVLKIKPLRNAAIRVIAFLYGLDAGTIISMRENQKDLYSDLGLAIFLAGMYLGIAEADIHAKP